MGEITEASGSAEHIKQGPVVAILDAGAQYGGLIDRAVWEGGIRTEMLPIDTPADELQKYGAVIISGGPDSVYAEGSPDCDPDLFDGRVPVLGICYGMQLMAKHGGGQIERTDTRHDGVSDTWVLNSSLLYDGLASFQEVLLTHGDTVTVPPRGFRVSAGIEDVITGFEHPARKLYATQFHPESQDTANGSIIIKNFLNKVAGIEPYMDVKDLEREAIDYIKEYVGDRDVMLFLSGGVDSTVLATLMAKTIDPSRIRAFHIDTGFMRLHESDAVLEALGEAGIDVEVIEAADHFYQTSTTDKNGQQLPVLTEAYEPEHKRKNIGDGFMVLRERIIAEYGLADDVVLAQGSLRPDLIESGSLLASASGHADTIKTHHNDTEAVRRLRQAGRVCEPLQNFYKDQVRQLGRGLNLPDELVERQPFPGPGLAIRVLCSEGERQERATGKVILATPEVYGSKTSVELLPIRTVGVQGDERSYKPIAAAHTSFNLLTEQWQGLQNLAKVLPQREQMINRLVALTTRTPQDVEAVPSLTRTSLDPETVELLRGADAIVNDLLRQYGLDRALSQVPVILAPLAFSNPGNYSIAIRPFITHDFMTGRAALPGVDLPLTFPQQVADKLFAYSPQIDAVMYDLSSKPPGTTEWE